jgi:Uma2 family endonuclease
MTVTAFDHGLPWTEEEYLALGETPDRVGLIDGSRLAIPAPTREHQTVTRRSASLLEPAASHAGLEAREAAVEIDAAELTA